MSNNPSRRLRRRSEQKASKEYRRRYIKQTTPDDRAVHNATSRLYHQRLREALENGERPDKDELWAQCQEEADDFASLPGEDAESRSERLAAQTENTSA